MKINSYSSRAYIAVFAIYVGSGPVYWMPWVNLQAIGILKALLFLVVVLWPLLHDISLSRVVFPGGRRVFPYLAAFFLLSIPGLLIGEFNASIYRLQNIVQVFLFLFSCGFLIKNGIIKPVAYLSVRIFISFSIVSLALMLIVPEYISPLNNELSLSQTGFGGSRTGWSPAIALYLPWLYAGFAVLSGSMAGVAAIGLIANQVLVGGRTGMVAAVVPLLFYGIFRKNIKVFILVAIVITLAVILAANNLEWLRLGAGGLGSRADLDELSTGRIEVYFGALGEILNSPFVGSGSGLSKFAGVHNVVLRAAVEGGIPYALSIVGLILIALRMGWRGIRTRNWFVVSAFMTVLSGVVSSLFEPVGMLGSFNNAPFWWLCFAICVSEGSGVNASPQPIAKRYG